MCLFDLCDDILELIEVELWGSVGSETTRMPRLVTLVRLVYHVVVLVLMLETTYVVPYAKRVERL